ncbi:hypothetical protein Tco_0366859 [Tanacetum coccineum]
MAIPKDLITEAIQNSEYYKKYLEMAARKPRQPTTKTGEDGGKKKKAPEFDKSKQPSPAKQTRPVKEKTSKPTPSKKIHKGRVIKVRKEKRSDHLVDKEDKESQPAVEPQVEDDEYNLQRGLIRKLLEVEGNGKGIVSEEQVAQSLLDLQKPKKKNDTSVNVDYDTSSPADSTNDADNVADMELSTSKADTEILNVDEEHGEEVSHTVALEERTVELDEGQAGSDPEEEPRKANVETEVKSMVIVPINQESSSVPSLSTPIIDLTPPKPVSPLVQEPIFTATTTTTTTLPPPPTPLPQSTTNSDLGNRVTAQEKRSADFKLKHQLQDKITKALTSKVYKMEHHDLY